MISNFDEVILLSKKVDPAFPADPQHQAMRIAIYDEYRAHAFYSKVIEYFGPVPPFINITDAESRHIHSLLHQFEHMHLIPPNNDWYARLSLPSTLVECCELGVAGEIENINMYDSLIPLIRSPEVRDIFYRLQAASFNNHLPAFRRCVQAHFDTPESESSSTEGDGGFVREILEGLEQSIHDPKQRALIHSLKNGSPAEKGKILGGIIGSMITRFSFDEVSR